MGLLAPVRLAVTLSVAVRVCRPAVNKVALKLPTPAASVPLAGTKTALVSLPVKLTVPL